MPPPHCLPPALRRPPDCPHHPGAQAANPTTCLRLSFSNPGGSTYSKHGFHFYRQASPGNSSAHNQRPCLSNPLPHPPRPSGAEGAHHTRAAKVLSMVFSFVAPNPLGIHPAKNQKPCLSELLPHRDATATPGRPQQPHTAHLLSLDFREMLHNNPPTRPETMLRTFTAQPGKASATLLSHTTGAANLISMVFRIHHPKPPGAGAPAKGKPCLAFLLPT